MGNIKILSGARLHPLPRRPFFCIIRFGYRCLFYLPSPLALPITHLSADTQPAITQAKNVIFFIGPNAAERYLSPQSETIESRFSEKFSPYYLRLKQSLVQL